eukprot:CAMPEP_0175042886 /NCGR_PEP_ID=MMETSP0052_2-20121109/2840_1 /TAXON_ID=51329 ORGANISM="Polytomella parva, Strain SAG 63-3" /NCGR_SAMPLE_ID=MMETSP0052_2 /ASSEMBLY_ACC=CAM_ASM_000194 /LENGTH=728 /DNA_ID=CAMNT_0016305803 /DNA_START=687 /DNA_END=2873 /DNA_ORIENTATION=-
MAASDASNSCDLCKQGFYNNMWTNIHLHGLYVDPGAQKNLDVSVQQIQWAGGYCQLGVPNATTIYGDYIFSKIKPGGHVAKYNFNISTRNPAPGIGWYHPHNHGSSSYQTSTASGPFIVPESTFGGLSNLYTSMKNRVTECDNVMRIMNSQPNDVATVLYFSGIFLRNNTADVGIDPIPDDDTIGFLGCTSNPPNPMICATGDSSQMTNFTNPAGVDWVLVNSNMQPNLNITAEKYKRLQIVNGMPMKWLDLTVRKIPTNPTNGIYTFTELANCTMYLTGLDGVPLLEIPRKLTSTNGVYQASDLIMPAASRADILLRCDTPGTYALVSGAGPWFRHADCDATHCELYGDTPWTNYVTPYNANHFHGNFRYSASILMTLTVNNRSVADAADVPFKDRTSCALNVNKFDHLNPKKFVTNANEVVDQCLSFMSDEGGGACHINNQDFMFSNASICIKQGSYQRWTIRDTTFHPAHMHTHHMQVTKYPTCVSGSTQYAVGDWHDTFMVPTCTCSGTTDPVRRCDAIKTRFGVAHFGTAANVPDDSTYVCKPRLTVYHCHVLSHEDEGCMWTVYMACPSETCLVKTCPPDYPVDHPIPGHRRSLREAAHAQRARNFVRRALGHESNDGAEGALGAAGEKKGYTEEEMNQKLMEARKKAQSLSSIPRLRHRDHLGMKENDGSNEQTNGNANNNSGGDNVENAEWARGPRVNRYGEDGVINSKAGLEEVQGGKK